jgi:predicted nucleic acid-binding protein
MRKILIDTDILINFLRGRIEAKKFLSSTIMDCDLYCSTISIAEICAGMKDHEREKTSELLDSLTIIDVTREIAEKAGSYKRRIKSQSLELDDCLIAAAASVNRAILATGNGKHYPMKDIKKKVISFRP